MIVLEGNHIDPSRIKGDRLEGQRIARYLELRSRLHVFEYT